MAVAGPYFCFPVDMHFADPLQHGLNGLRGVWDVRSGACAILMDEPKQEVRAEFARVSAWFDPIDKMAEEFVKH